MEKRVAIVGAGISGLLACKYMAAKGLKPVVFEEQDVVGGLWNHTYECTTLQTPKENYHFSDFPWPSSVGNIYPHNTQVIQYLQSYAHHFQLLQYVKFNSKVMDVNYVGESKDEMESWDLWGGTGKAFGSKGTWILRVAHTKDGSLKEYEAEFLVICIGRFSGQPNIPEFAPGYGPEVFSGKVLHSMDYSKMENAAAADLIKGKRVVVIGSSKSAVDVAFECANANGKEIPCTMIQRTIHWMLPHSAWPSGMHIGYLCFTRFVELMVHKPQEGGFSSIVATLLTPMRWGTNKLLEAFIKWRLPLKKYDMIPKESFLGEVSSCEILLSPPNFFDRVEDGSIILQKSPSFTFCKQGLILDGQDEVLKADIVVFATGYKGDEKLKNIFASPTFQRYIAGSPSSTIPLYRQMIHPRIPQMAVIGYSEALSSIFTFEMRCKWLAHLLEEGFQLPSMREMEKEIGEWVNYFKRYSGNDSFRRSCVGGVAIWYNDQICTDMGANPRRKNNFYAEFFQPYTPADYQDL